MELSYRPEDVWLQYKPESMLKLDHTILEGFLLITAARFPHVCLELTFSHT